MFENQPKGLYALALANTGERFGYYTMLAIFTLFMHGKLRDLMSYEADDQANHKLCDKGSRCRCRVAADNIKMQDRKSVV